MHKRVYIEWIDSASLDGWQGKEALDDLRPYNCATLAFLVREDDEAYIVTHTFTLDDATDSFAYRYHGLFSIPKVAVSKLHFYD